MLELSICYPLRRIDTAPQKNRTRMQIPTGKLIAAGRRLLDLSQAELAARAAVSERTLAAYEACGDETPAGAKLGHFERAMTRVARVAVSDGATCSTYVESADRPLRFFLSGSEARAALIQELRDAGFWAEEQICFIQIDPAKYMNREIPKT